MSNAFEKSIKALIANSFSLKELEIRLECCKTACSVECEEGMPNCFSYKILFSAKKS